VKYFWIILQNQVARRPQSYFIKSIYEVTFKLKCYLVIILTCLQESGDSKKIGEVYWPYESLYSMWARNDKGKQYRGFFFSIIILRVKWITPTIVTYYSVQCISDRWNPFNFGMKLSLLSGQLIATSREVFNGLVIVFVWFSNAS